MTGKINGTAFLGLFLITEGATDIATYNATIVNSQQQLLFQ